MPTVLTLALAAVLGAPLAATLGATPAAAAGSAPGNTVRTLLGGSPFPFDRSFPRVQSERCKRLVERKRLRRDDQILNVQDRRDLRRNGCRNFPLYGR